MPRACVNGVRDGTGITITRVDLHSVNLLLFIIRSFGGTPQTNPHGIAWSICGLSVLLPDGGSKATNRSLIHPVKTMKWFREVKKTPTYLRNPMCTSIHS